MTSRPTSPKRPAGVDLGAAGDRTSHQLLVGAIRHRHPTDAILSEEAADNGARLIADRVWIIDPLDGTREFAQEGREDWAVHVALWPCGLEPSCPRPRQPRTAPSLPSMGRCASSSAARARRASPPTSPASGSAGAKTIAVVLGEAHAYIHAGGQYKWDSAAPPAVAAAAGLHVSRLEGTPLRYNQRDPSLPDLVVCRPGRRAPPRDRVSRGDAGWSVTQAAIPREETPEGRRASCGNLPRSSQACCPSL